MTRRKAFTLIEMLLVVSLIVLLIALLLPNLKAARDAARLVVCASNLSQCASGLTGYGVDNKGVLPSPPDSATQAHLIRHNTTFDLRVLMRPYVGGFGAWTCPDVDAPTIDNVLNTRSTAYSPYRLYSGRVWPDFGTPEPAPKRMHSKNAASRHPLMQDVTALIIVNRPWVPIPGGGKASGAIFNHGNGQLLTFTSDNPSWRFRYSDTSAGVIGANILFFDNAVTWVRAEKLQPVGSWNVGDAGLDLSVLP